jgi:hypothetical protein
MSEREVNDHELLEAERRARAALRGEPPTVAPAEGVNAYTLTAGPAVLDFIREVGPPLVLKLVAEIRRLRAEEEHLIGRLRSVETWSLEADRRQ